MTLVRFPRLATQALAVLVAMSRIPEGEIATLGSIALAARVPLTSVEELIQHLRRAGLVRSIRGRGGGYALGRSAADITVHDVVTCLSATASGSEQAGPWDAVTAELDRVAEQLLRSATIADFSKAG